MKGIIYGIREISTGEILYVGSTINFKRRVNAHINNCFNNSGKYPLRVYVYIRGKCDKENFRSMFSIDIIKELEVDTVSELRITERKYIEEISPKYNKNRAYVYEEEYRKENAEYTKSRRELKPEYNEYLIKKTKQFFEDHPDYYKNWVENNREKKREATRRYREKLRNMKK